MPMTQPPFSLREVLKALIIREDFTSPDECRRLVELHQAGCPAPDVLSNNVVQVLKIAEGSVDDGDFLKSIISRITSVLVEETADGHRQGVDFAALTARLTGNRCVLHADNARYVCDEEPELRAETLREQIRSGKFAGLPAGKFGPNHTPNREYTALLYLNDDHVGGDLWFQDSVLGDTYRLRIAAKAGVLVIHPNGPAFFHETDTVTEGTRYSLNVWYSSDMPIGRGEQYLMTDQEETGAG